MKSATKSLLLIGAASYLLAWFVPVIAGGDNLTSGTLPGWQAFRAALSPISPYQPWYARPEWYWSALYVVSALTNFVLVGGLLRIIRAPDRPHSALRMMLFASATFNTWFLLTPGRGDLRLGYYLWLIAYFLIAAGVASSRTSTTSEQGTPTAV